MGIRMLHRRTTHPPGHADAPTRVPLPPVPAHALTASTARTPATVACALRHTAQDLRRRLAPPDPLLRALTLGDAARCTDPPLWRQWTNLVLVRIDLTLRGTGYRPGDPVPWRQWATIARARLGPAVRLAPAVRLSRAFGPGRPLPWRQWADVARGYLALALAALPGPRPVQTVTVFVAVPRTSTGHPYGRDRHRRRRDDRGPGPGRGPDAAP